MRAAHDVDLGAGGVFCEGEEGGLADLSGGADEDCDGDAPLDFRDVLDVKLAVWGTDAIDEMGGLEV